MTENPTTDRNSAGRRRGWMAVAIACLVAAVILGVLLIPGVLRYPDPEASPLPLSAQAVEDTNRALEDRIRRLRTLLDSGVCVDNGEYARPGIEPGQDAQPLPPEDSGLLPPPPEATPVPETSVPGQGNFSGSLVDLIDQSTFLVLRVDERNAVTGMGTGFAVGPQHILTNQHVTDLKPGIRILVAGKALPRPTETEVVAETPGSEIGSADFALLKVDASPAPFAFLKIAPEAPRLTPVIVGGYPVLITDTDDRFKAFLEDGASFVPEPAVTEGVITAAQPSGDMTILLHTAQVTPGNSGGPLIDRCGRVVGVNTFVRAGQRGGGRMNYALSGRNAIAFLAENNVTSAEAPIECVPEAPAPAPTADPAPGGAPAAPQE